MDKSSDKNDSRDIVVDWVQKSVEDSEKITKIIAPVFKYQKRIKLIKNLARFPKITIDASAIEKINSASISKATQNLKKHTIMDNSVYGNKSAKEIVGMDLAIKTLQNQNAFGGLSEVVTKSMRHQFKFESPMLGIYDEWSNKEVTNMAARVSSLISNPVLQKLQDLPPNLGKWLQQIGFLPLIRTPGNAWIIDFKVDYDKAEKIFLKAMFDARWFPYAGWNANFRIVDEMIGILNTSRASKNRIKRIDKLIFSYYDKEEINNFKRRWRKMHLPSYMTRIMIQSVQAYHRREYALTVSALSTLWEGIIQEKVNEDGFRTSGKTRGNLGKLIEKNEFDEMFVDFCNQFIFYNCTAPEEVKPDVPGRHGIAHSWYNTYPNRKMALNAILFTDFLLKLEPIEDEL